MERAAQVQWYDEVALVRDGKVLHVLLASGSKGVLPDVQRVSPLAIITSAPSTVQIMGSNIATPDNTILARSQGAPGLSLLASILSLTISKHAKLRGLALPDDSWLAPRAPHSNMLRYRGLRRLLPWLPVKT
jgi:hypothetical protein